MSEDYPRKALVPGRIYYCAPSDDYFYTPDGIGCIWYDTREEAVADTGITSPVITIHAQLED